MGRKAKPKKQPLAFFYERIDGHYRWWRNIDGGDQFDMFDSEEELRARIAAAKMISAIVIDHLPAFCTLEGCDDCVRYA